METKIESALDLISDDEGENLFPYKDSLGFWTIGRGRCIEKVGIRKSESLLMCQNDITECESYAVQLPWYERLSTPRQAVILSMFYIFGPDAFRQFPKTADCIAKSDYEGAAREMLDSKWQTQAPRRVQRLARIMQTGEWP